MQENRNNTGRYNDSEYDHEVLEIARVVRVVKGGRRFRFRASVLVGDRNGKVGLGTSKSKDVQQAIQKAQGQAEKHLVKIPLKDGTIPHRVEAKFKGAHIIMRPARPGAGLIAGSVVRMVAELVGIKDIVSKRYGSTNKVNNAKAVFKALQQIQS